MTLVDERVYDGFDPAVQGRVRPEVDGPVLEENDFAHRIVRGEELARMIRRGKTDGCQAIFLQALENGIIPFIHEIPEIDPHRCTQV
jgi:hypothetical protein